MTLSQRTSKNSYNSTLIRPCISKFLLYQIPMKPWSFVRNIFFRKWKREIFRNRNKKNFAENSCQDWYERSILKTLIFKDCFWRRIIKRTRLQNKKLAMKDNTAKEHFKLIPNFSQSLLYPLKSCLKNIWYSTSSFIRSSGRFQTIDWKDSFRHLFHAWPWKVNIFHQRWFISVKTIINHPNFLVLEHFICFQV